MIASRKGRSGRFVEMINNFSNLLMELFGARDDFLYAELFE